MTFFTFSLNEIGTGNALATKPSQDPVHALQLQANLPFPSGAPVEEGFFMPPLNIGFVLTRLSGTDGVTLETWKWVRVLEEWGHRCFFFAGVSEAPPERSMVVPEAHFQHPDVLRIQRDLFDDLKRDQTTSRQVTRLKNFLKQRLHRFARTFDLNLLIVPNALSLPMNVPLGLALTEFIAETGMMTIGHHHDFYWERTRYLVNAAADYLRAAFPPALPTLHHVVINSLAQQQLAWYAGINSLVIPNVMDFETPPKPPDAYADDLRQELNIPEGAYFILQPTRIVPRKRIERAIELVRRLGRPAVLVISHAAGDEGMEYARYLKEYAALLGVDVRFAAARIARHRSRDAQGRKVYALADVYQKADLVTYPSQVEGFGNAFLEAVYYRRPLVCNLYAIFRLDIQPKGFRVLTFDEFISDRVVENVRTVLEHPERAQAMIEHNYRLGLKHFSMRVLRRRLGLLLSLCLGENHGCPPEG